MQAMKNAKSIEGIENILSIPEFFKKQVTGYYKNYSGMRQVRQVLNWLEKNEASLLVQFQNDVKSGLIPFSSISKNDANASKKKEFIFGMWLGGRYCRFLLAPEAQNPVYPKINFEAGLGRISMGVQPGYMVIRLGGKKLSEYAKACGTNASALVAGFNIGLHEHTHLINHITINDYSKYHPYEPVSELGATFVENIYALPAYVSEAKPTGTKNFYRKIIQIVKKKDIKELYNAMGDDLAYVIAPWIANEYGGIPPVMDFTISDGIFESYSMDDLAGLRKKFSMKEFLKYAGIRNKSTIKKLKAVFDYVSKFNWRGREDEFIAAFMQAMNKQFGKPDAGDFLETFALSPGENINLVDLLPIRTGEQFKN